MNKFTCSLGRSSLIVTWLIGIMTVAYYIGGYMFNARSGHNAWLLLAIWTGPLILTALMIVMFCLRPISINVDEEGITIMRKIKPIFIPFSEIINIRAVAKDEMAGVLRSFGNGGLFGYTGSFDNKQLGFMTWYCTRRSNYILIDKTNPKRIIITPDDPAGFIKAVQLIVPEIATNS